MNCNQPSTTPADTSDEPPPTEPEESLPSPDLSLDTDGDGFSDWFEINIANYDPLIPNDRYVIIFDWLDTNPSGGRIPQSQADFFTQKGKIPSENIILLITEEDATRSGLKNAIEEVAQKADENDIVLVRINSHGYTIQELATPASQTKWASSEEAYATIDEWLDEIRAKVVIVTISACEADQALPATEKGPYPRIVYINATRAFFDALGVVPDFFTMADIRPPEIFSPPDIEFGDGNGYVSLKEVETFLKYCPMPPLSSGQPDINNGRILFSDPSNLASQIYLTDYTPSIEEIDLSEVRRLREREED